jgi:hypothetical protein
MIRFLLASITGWGAVFGVGIETGLPYMLRRRPPAISSGLPIRSPSWRTRMWPHYWIGYALVGLVLAHTSIVMGPAMGRSDSVGIWAATLALCLMFFQVGLGLILKSGSRRQQQARRLHFLSMIGFIALVLTHVLRNG